MNTEDENRALTPEDEERERQTQLAIDEFFGEKDALKTSTIVDTGLTTTQRSVDRAINGDDPAEVIDQLQQENILPESIHSRALANILRYLGKLGIRIHIGKAVLFPGNGFTLNLSPDNLATFLKRGALAGTFLVPLMMSSQALAAGLQPGMDLVNEASNVVNSGHTMYHWEYLIIILPLLGISAAIALKIAKKYKKTEEEKAAKAKLKKYKKAAKKGTPEEKAKAKEELYDVLMGELPASMEQVLESSDVDNQKEVDEALKLKHEIDATVQKTIQEITESMVLPEDQTIDTLNKKRDEVIALIDQKLQELADLYDALSAKWQLAKDGSLLKQQIEIQKQKIHYIENYLKLGKKKWLVVVQMAKNKILLTTADPTTLGEADKMGQEVVKLQAELVHLLDQQKDLDDTTFHTDLDKLDQALSQKIADLKAAHPEAASTLVPEKDKTETVKENGSLSLENSGIYNHTTGINYSITTPDNNKNDHHINLAENIEVHIWITYDGNIKMNFSHIDILLDTTDLVIANGELQIKNTNQPLKEYIEEKTKEIEAKKAKGEEIKQELSPEAEPVLKELTALVQNIADKVKKDQFEYYGSSVTADAIENHLFRVHREFFEGKRRTVLRFKLNESYQKQAIDNILQDPTLPKNTTSFDFEGPNGEKASVSVQVHRFNIVVGTTKKKQVTVLVPTSNNQYLTLAGEIRVIFDQDNMPSPDETKEVLAKLTHVLGIQNHIKPVTPQAKKKLQAHWKAISKTDAKPSGSTTSVNPEYQAETLTPEAVEDLKSKGLVCVYQTGAMTQLEHVFKSGTLMSTLTRWSKGLLKHGMSSTKDLSNGGAAGVFTRILTKNAIDSLPEGSYVFRPSILQRMDCYCYTSDQFGSKIPGTFDQRVSPTKLVESMMNYFNTGNEVMFHDAVPVDEVMYIVHSNPPAITARLKKIGVTQIGGKPLEEAVITKEQFKKIKL
jgi:Tfp pilus assembly major pilin PilA